MDLVLILINHYILPDTLLSTVSICLPYPKLKLVKISVQHRLQSISGQTMCAMKEVTKQVTS